MTNTTNSTTQLDHRIHQFLDKKCAKFPGLTQKHIISNLLLNKGYDDD